MDNSTQDPSTLFGCDVIDSAGNNIGTVDNVWVDDATNELEFIGVKTGWLFGKTHVIPCADAQITDGAITVPYGQDQIKDAPSYGADDELSPDNEQEIYSYYGLDRSTAPSPTGLATGETGTGYGSDVNTADTSDYAATDTDTQNLRLHEEELNVGKRRVEAGNVRLRKVVTTEHQEVPVELEHEEVEIERVPVSDSSIDDSTAFEEQEIDVPVMREEAVVGKEVRATGQVQVNKNVRTQTENVGADVRKENIETDDTTDTSTSGTGFARTGYTTDDTDSGL
jgi:uncharacterized protein (TIGR02271 family)